MLPFQDHLLRSLLFFLSALALLDAPLILAHDSPEETLIRIDESSITPPLGEVHIGERVVFENIGKESHWIASDSHPSHAGYDGTTLEKHCESKELFSFDSCRGIAPGESWEFVFQKEGRFAYHDHLFPHLRGEILVLDHKESSFFSSFIAGVRNFFFQLFSFFTKKELPLGLSSGNTDGEFYRTLTSRYALLAESNDPSQTLKILEEESVNDPRASALCHDISHLIGRAAYARYGGFEEAAKFQSEFCNSGYIHGVFEAYFEHEDQPLLNLGSQCEGYGSGRAFDAWQCHHGIGHGFMYLTGGDLQKSLSLCLSELLGEARESCLNGAYMELFNKEILAKEKLFVDPENPLRTCQKETSTKADCYLYLPVYFSSVQGDQFEEIFSECQRAEKGYEHYCVSGVGAEAMKRNMENPDLVMTLCERALSSRSSEDCMRGAIRMYLNQKGSYDSGKKVCELIAQRLIPLCSQTAQEQKSFFE